MCCYFHKSLQTHKNASESTSRRLVLSYLWDSHTLKKAYICFPKQLWIFIDTLNYVGFIYSIPVDVLVKNNDEYSWQERPGTPRESWRRVDVVFNVTWGIAILPGASSGNLPLHLVSALSRVFLKEPIAGLLPGAKSEEHGRHRKIPITTALVKKALCGPLVVNTAVHCACSKIAIVAWKTTGWVQRHKHDLSCQTESLMRPVCKRALGAVILKAWLRVRCRGNRTPERLNGRWGAFILTQKQETRSPGLSV